MADSGDTSPHSAAATDDTHHDGSDTSAASAAAAVTAPTTAAALHAPPPPQQPPPSSKVRLMVSYGGRIQPRPHDNQLAYVNGETKILSLERPLRFADFAARLAALVGGGLADHLLCVKYQLPGEDLDALVSVTNDEDLDHLVLEYDRLHLLRPAAPPSGTGSARGGSSNLRLRVFLFPVQSPPPPPQPPSGLLDPKPDRHWFVEALNTVPQPPTKQDTPPPPPPAQQASPSPPQQQKQDSVVFAQQSSSSPPQQQKQEAVSLHHHQQQPPVVLTPVSPDYLFGLDNGFVPPPAVKVKDPAGEPPTVRENVPVELPAKTDNPAAAAAGGDHVAVSPVVSPAEFHRQIQELEKLQVADTASHPATLPRNGSDDSLTRAYPPPPPSTATATANNASDYYIPKFPEKPPVPPPSSAPPAATTYLQVPGRYTSVAPGSGADHAPVFFIPAPHGYYAATAASPGANSYQAMYAVAPPNANGSAPSQHGMSSAAAAYAPPPPQTQVAYDSNGRAIYYTSVLPQYPSAVNGMSAAGAVLGSEPAKPVPVKPTVS